MRTTRLLLWALTAALYAIFWYWYTPTGGALTDPEIDAYVAAMTRGEQDPEREARLRRFLDEDDGREFVMINLLDLADAPPELPATGAGATADDLMAHYMEHMYPALLKRACHPVFFGQAIYGALDLAGIEGGRDWTQGAAMRYRSRRDMMEIASNPAFSERHEYKMGALDKTIAFPVAPVLNPGDLRFVLALLLFSLASALHLLVLRR